MPDGRPLERPFQDPDDIIATQQADQNSHARSRGALDQDPPKVFKMLEEGLDRPTLVVLWLFVQVFRFGFVGHARNRLANQDLLPELDCGTVCCASGCVLLGGKDLGGGGGGSSIAE